MKNIIPFKKDVIFKTKISEIISISLENTLELKDDVMKGEFIINGEYKINDNSNTVDPFNLNLPFEILIDEKYETSKAIIDIDDFYYEIVNDSVLRIAIDVLIDKLEEKILINDFQLVDETPKREIIEEDIKEERCIEPEEIVEKVKKEVIEERDTKKDMSEKMDSLFNQISKDSEIYVTYNIYVVREGDTLEYILDKYQIQVDELKKYNDLSELKLGDKLIIPSTYEKN